MNPRNDAAILCKNHPEAEAVDNWPWKKADRYCYVCIDNQQAVADAQIKADKIRGPSTSGGEQFGSYTGFDSNSVHGNPNHVYERWKRESHD